MQGPRPGGTPEVSGWYRQEATRCASPPYIHGMQHAFVLLFVAAFFGACQMDSTASAEDAGSTTADTDLTAFAQTMAGHYSSAEQAGADSAYFDIRLHMVPIWGSAADLDTVWLYVEQAAAGYLDRPYRQRVYRLTAESGADGPVYRSAVYTLAAPLRFAGVWDSVVAFESLTPDSLEERSGCDILLTRQEDGSFAGSTGESNCPSALRGASYATSEVTMRADELVSWDRGWDADGQQVWGAEKGGYVFKRVTAEKAAADPEQMDQQ